jgi:glycosyltransferase involved in cell wall biosynthesis
MHVLLLPSWYPSHSAPVDGIFFRDQAIALAASDVRTGVIFVERESMRRISLAALAHQRWQLTARVDEQVIEMRRHGWSIKPRILARQLWVRQMVKLGLEYAKRHGIPDVLHAHSAVWGSMAASELSAIWKRPFVVTEHRSNFLQDSWQPDAPAKHRAALARATRVVAVSKALASRMEAFAPGTHWGVIPNVVDTEFFAMGPSGVRPRGFTVLSAGILKEVKGFDILIRAFAMAMRSDADARLIICGDGPQRHTLEMLAADLGIANQVRFQGMVTRLGLRSLMKASSVFALASRRETFGVVLVEALAAGLPLVATRAGGSVDVVTADVGWTVPASDVQALAEALRHARDGKTRFDASALSASATQRFGRDVVVAQLRELYETVRLEHANHASSAGRSDRRVPA